jgi:1,4-alpha-glucan branching enzyme
MWAHPGKQLLFMGGEFGQEREWSESRSIDWYLLDDPLHAGIKTLVGDLNRTYRSYPALWTKDTTPEGFSWIDANDASGNVLSFLRYGVDADGKPSVVACIANFSGTPKPNYRVGLPFAGRWREILNTDAQIYGGSGVGNLGAVEAEQVVWHGRPASAVLQLPPAGVLWLAPAPHAGAVRRGASGAVLRGASRAGATVAGSAPVRPAADTTAPPAEPDLEPPRGAARHLPSATPEPATTGPHQGGHANDVLSEDLQADPEIIDSAPSAPAVGDAPVEAPPVPDVREDHA